MKKILFLTLFILAMTCQSKASHIAGADLTYQCLGGNDYLITFTLYRDCSGVTVENPVTIHFQSSCGSFNMSLYQVPGTGIEITPACISSPTTCSGGSIYGVREYVYQGTVTLQPCADWTFYYYQCCRNYAITTISNPGSAGIYIPATLNNAVLQGTPNPCNTSPVFSNKPVTIICNGQQFCFNHGAIEPDGDSLAYHFVTPYTSGPPGTGITWLGGYSASQPLSSSPPVTLDPITGDICMTPTMNQVTVMAVVCEEWREVNGTMVMIGSILRDMQMSVITCTNSLPQLTGMDSTSTYQMSLCLGDTVDFDVFSSDVDIANHLTISWNNGIPAGTFTITGNGVPPYRPQGHFNWVPNSGDISNTPHCFTVQVHDDACPYFGSQTFGYCITVKGMHVDLGIDTLLCKGETYTVTAIADTSAQNYYWFVDGNPQGVPLTDTTFFFNSATYPPGIHVITVQTNDGDTAVVCPGVDHITINVVQQPDVHLGNDTTICQGEQITLDAGIGTTYVWTGSIVGSGQTVNANQGGPISVIVDGGTNTRCKDADTLLLTVVDKPIVDLGPDSCSTVPLTLDAGNPGMIFNWSTSASSQTINAATSGTYWVEVVSLPGSNVCVDRDTVSIHVIPNPIVSLGPDTTICQHETIIFNVQNNGSEYIYSWQPTGASTSDLSISGFDYIGQNPLPVIANVTGCKTFSDTLLLTMIPCDLTVPNVITPNGDGMNDFFHVTNLEYYPNSTLLIYNRWGKKVYDNTNYQNDWDGDKHSDGVYYYILNINNKTEKGIEYHGTITIINKKK